MIGPSGHVRVMVATKPVDFRKGAEGLAALVRETMGADPFSGAIYVFRARRADRIKLVYFDGTGVCLLAKRLEEGKFCWPAITDGVVRLTAAQLQALLEGLDWRRVHDARATPAFRSPQAEPSRWQSLAAYAPIGSVSEPIAGLPDDPATLREMLAAERAENERLRQIIRELQRHRFGRRAESLPEDQLLLALEDAEQVEAQGFAAEDAADPAKSEARARRRRANRGSLPAHLPRIERVIDITSKTCPCCNGLLHVMGEDRSERLDVVPAQFRVIVIRRPNYACRACEVVMQAPAPARLVEGGIPTEAMVAHVLVAKYADHLPLYRQAQIYTRQGVSLDRSTLADWVGKAAFLLRPVHERLFERLKASAKLFADETTAPVLDPGRGRTKTGQLFAYARDDRAWGGLVPPGVAYLYAPDRKAENVVRHLAGFTGTLQVDGYAGYNVLAEKNAVSLAFCWSHVRRKFYELAQSGPAPIATEALARIAELYKIEGEIRGRSAGERRTVRQARSRPILAQLEPWLRAKLALVSQKSKLAEAIRYALARWTGLVRFLDDGRLEIDNNVVERSIRPIALNRKNALFAGSDGGAEHWATIASLVETAKLNGVDPQAYLADIITRIVAGHPQNQIDDLLPWAYLPVPLKAVA